MQINSAEAFVTVLISAVIGFGLAFYIERKINSDIKKRSAQILVSVGMISFGYGLSFSLNEMIAFPLVGLAVRVDKIIILVLGNMIILPLIFIGIAKFLDFLNKSESLIHAGKSTEIINAKSNLASTKIQKINTNSKIIDDESIWEQAFKEFESEGKRNGLWARLLVEFEGDNDKAKIKYLKVRFEELKSELNAKIEIEKVRKNKEQVDKQISANEKAKGLSTEECIEKGFYELKEFQSKKYYSYPNGEVSILINDEHFIYDTEDSLKHSITTHSEISRHIGDNPLLDIIDDSMSSMPPAAYCRKYSILPYNASAIDWGYIGILEKNNYKFLGADTKGESIKYCLLFNKEKKFFNRHELEKCAKEWGIKNFKSIPKPR